MSQTHSQQRLDYIEYDNLLSHLDTDLGLSEAHGLLIGLLCVKPFHELDTYTWWRELGEDLPVWQDLDDDTQQQLALLIQRSYAELVDPLYSFTPFLPDDDDALNERTQALGEWCIGFIAGLGLGGYYVNPDALQNEVSEAIAKLASDSMEQSEEEERAFSEVLEYVRVAVLLIANALSSLQKGESSVDDRLLH